MEENVEKKRGRRRKDTFRFSFLITSEKRKAFARPGKVSRFRLWHVLPRLYEILFRRLHVHGMPLRSCTFFSSVPTFFFSVLTLIKLFLAPCIFWKENFKLATHVCANVCHTCVLYTRWMKHLRYVYNWMYSVYFFLFHGRFCDFCECYCALTDVVLNAWDVLTLSKFTYPKQFKKSTVIFPHLS